MEYVQMTLNDWVEMKRKLRRELLGVKQSFVRIGYILRKIEDQKLYENDGYKSIAKFAKEEYGLEPSTTSRFMSINREYSIDGYSEQLRAEYADLGRSQLEEMLKLPENDRKMIQKETSREDIRDLKRFNKTEPAAGEAEDLSQLIEQFFHDNRETLNTLFRSLDTQKPVIEQLKAAKEIVNPSGNRSYRKGMFFLMMYDNRISVKKFGDTPRDLTWEQFLQMVWERFRPYEAGEKTWENYFGEETQKADDLEQREAEKGSKRGEKHSSIDNKNAAAGNESSEKESKKEKEPKLNPESEIAPAQESEEILDKTEPESLVGKAIESIEQKAFERVMVPPEIVEKPFGSRKEWFNTLTVYGAATELAAVMKDMIQENLADMTEVAFWEKWFGEEVDDHGRTTEQE